MSSPNSRFKVLEHKNDGEFLVVQFDDEDHTLANALRYMIAKNSDVKFCGYSMPHPSEPHFLMQIQTYSGKLKAIDVLKKGLNDLVGVCQHIKTVFETECENYANKNSD